MDERFGDAARQSGCHFTPPRSVWTPQSASGGLGLLPLLMLDDGHQTSQIDCSFGIMISRVG